MLRCGHDRTAPSVHIVGADHLRLLNTVRDVMGRNPVAVGIDQAMGDEFRPLHVYLDPIDAGGCLMGPPVNQVEPGLLRPPSGSDRWTLFRRSFYGQKVACLLEHREFSQPGGVRRFSPGSASTSGHLPCRPMRIQAVSSPGRARSRAFAERLRSSRRPNTRPSPHRPRTMSSPRKMAPSWRAET